ncbi:MAG: hypothetical protein ACLUQX_00840 [Thomasclavelia spiroformis]
MNKSNTYFLISNIIKEHHELLKSDKLDEVDKNKLEKYRSGESTITEIKKAYYLYRDV